MLEHYIPLNVEKYVTVVAYYLAGWMIRYLFLYNKWTEKQKNTTTFFSDKDSIISLNRGA